MNAQHTRTRRYGMALVGVAGALFFLAIQPVLVGREPPRRAAEPTPGIQPGRPTTLVQPGPAQGGQAPLGVPLMKPGFYFNPTLYPSLIGYVIDTGNDDILTTDLDKGLIREVDLVDIGPGVRLRFRIAVSHIDEAAASQFFQGFTFPSQRDPADRLVTGASLGLSIGDVPIETLVSSSGPPGSAYNEIAFRRKNVFVSIRYIRESGPDSLNITDIATEIDASVAALPDVTFAAFEAARPVIDAFSAVIPNLIEAQLSDLNVAYHDPNASTVSRLYLADDGDVIPNLPDKYRAGSLIGAQDLTLLVYNRELMFRTSSVVFVVTP